ncbi:MAG: 5-formyltetrahydrofolate cyclo-ligase [Caulobacteraceae bacterium]|nr:5-formyltetrahydrofolate cyclo-ligase [Caulobacteraceae bacterium]
MTETKAELRSRMRAERKQLKLALPDAGARAAAHLHAVLSAQPVEVRTVALYVPMGSELDTAPLAAELRRRGLRLLLPRVREPDQPLDFLAWEPGQALEPDLQGCSAPPAGSDPGAPDLILVPLLAFDRRGGRLGQGGGYYDRTLAALHGRRRPLFVGLGFAGQEVAQAPLDPHDQKLDGILTERGYMPARKDA